jgi:hypothetical protein
MTKKKEECANCKSKYEYEKSMEYAHFPFSMTFMPKKKEEFANCKSKCEYE